MHSQKIADNIHHSQAEQQEQPTSSPPPERQRGFLDRIGDAVGDLGAKSHQDTPAPPPPPPKNESIFDKIGDALKGEEHTSPPPPPPKPEGFFDKISDAIHGHEQPEEPPKPQSFAEKFGDKVNSTFGGGSSGEAKEGHLDKAIDFYQEHVLKQGKQDDESAVEQLKDKQIASVIRHGFESVTGKDLSSSHKE
ncbi:hypothetical protein Agabi119p4_8851 [Agaricus bisporus var. burnettii]|nr:hypothetical protein Agabi119p4_8851 [Agaricus bisporus var. burnettii]